jgi:hypothetical protein
MASKLEILNRALALLGVERISALDEDSAQRETADAVYPDCLSAALSRHRWTFARLRTTQLPALVGDSAEGFPRYPKPSDALALVRLFDANDRTYHFKLDGAEILPDEGDDLTGVALFLSYVGGIDEGLLPGYFVKAFSYELAAELCEPLTENATKSERLQEAAERFFRDAVRIDAQSEGNQSLIDESQLSMIAGR